MKELGRAERTADPTPILSVTLLLFWVWPYSHSEDDPTPILRLTLLPIWVWPYSQSVVDPTPNILCTLLWPYSAPTRHLLCTYSQIKSRIPTFYQSFSPCPRGRIIKMHHADFPSLFLLYYICCHFRDPFCIFKIHNVTLEGREFQKLSNVKLSDSASLNITR